MTTVAQGDADFIGVGDNVAVGQDIARLGVHDDAGTHRLELARARPLRHEGAKTGIVQQGIAFNGDRPTHRDVDHRRCDPLDQRRQAREPSHLLVDRRRRGANRTGGPHRDNDRGCRENSSLHLALLVAFRTPLAEATLNQKLVFPWLGVGVRPEPLRHDIGKRVQSGVEPRDISAQNDQSVREFAYRSSHSAGQFGGATRRYKSTFRDLRIGPGGIRGGIRGWRTPGIREYT